MASVTEKSSSQSLACRLIQLDAGESAIVTFAAPNNRGPGSMVNWGGGGASWSVVPTSGNLEDDIEFSVDYSLFREGDEDWINHIDSPFEEAKQENEWGRCDRIRFTNDGAASIYVTVGSNDRFGVDTQEAS